MSFLRDKKAQVSFEYLLTVTFAILLVTVVAVFALNLRSISTKSSDKILDYRNKYFENVFG